MTDPLPPLPKDDDDLEALMSKHLEPVAPSVYVRARTLQSLQKEATRSPRWPLLLAASLGLVAVAAVYVTITQTGTPPLVPPQVVTDTETRASELALEILAELESSATLDERLSVCERALELDPSCAPALVARARLHFLLDRRPGSKLEPVARAREDVNRALSHADGLPEAYLLRAELALFENDGRAALSNWRRVEEADPEGALGRLARGFREELSRRYGDALTHFDHAIELDSKLVPAYLARARVYVKQGTYSKAIASADQARNLDPFSAEAHLLLAEARYFASGRRGRGVLRLLDTAVDLDPGGSRAFALRAYARLERTRTRGQVISSVGECERAEADATKANSIRDEPLAWMTLAELAIWQEDDKAKAQKYAKRAIGLDGRNSEAFLLRARVLILAGHYGEADRDLERVLTLAESRPGTEELTAHALTLRAGIRVANKDFTAAKDLLKRAIKLNNDLAEAHFYYAKVLHHDPKRQSGDWRRAEQEYSKAISIDGTLADAWFHRGALHIDRSRGEGAVPEWEEGLDDLKKAEELMHARYSTYFQPYYLDLMRGVAYYGLKEWDRAKKHLQAFVDEASPGEENYAKAKTMLRVIEAGPQKPDIDLTPQPRTPTPDTRGDWRFKPGKAPDVSADMDYGQLKILLKAETIVIGRVAKVDGEGAGILKQVEVIRGQRPAKAPTVGEFNGCEGVPSFEHHVGHEVAVFLHRKGNELQILHGGSGIQRLPFRGKLDAGALKALVEHGALAEKELLGLIEEHGLGVLDWLEGHLPGAAARSSEAGVQAKLRGQLPGLTPKSSRPLVMSVLRFLKVKQLTDAELDGLWAYQSSFTENRYGTYVSGTPNFSNRIEHHHTYLRFMARFHPVEALVEAESALQRVTSADRPYPPIWIKASETLVEELKRKADEGR